MKNLAFVKSVLCTVLVSFALLQVSCVDDIKRGSGSIASETRTFSSDFQEIRIEGSIDCLIKQGNDVSAVVKDFSNLLPLIETKVVGNTLVIKYADNTWVTNSEGVVTVTVPKLKAIKLDGSADVGTIGSFNFEDLGILIDGSGNFSLSGSATKTDVVIDGSGDYDAFNLVSEATKVKISGSGNAEVTSNKTLEVVIDGSGDLIYKGNPTVNAKVSGSGSVRKF